MAPKKKPTTDEILELYDDCKRRYSESGLYEQFAEDERFYELDFRQQLLLPKEFMAEGIVLPTARDLVDTCVDNTDIFNARVWVNRKGTSKQSDEDANLLRKFGLGVLYRNNVEATIAPIRVGAKHYWMHGLTIIKDVWDADRWAGRPERKEDEGEGGYAARIDEWRSEHHDSIPIVIQSINPNNIMLDPYYDGGMFVFETQEELCFNVKQRYSWWGNPQGKKITDKVEHISFWTKDFRCEFYDREPILKVTGGVAKHTYGLIPYVPIDTGLGNISADNDLKKRYVGILRYVKDLIISESRDYSIGDIILKKQAWPWGYIKGVGGQGITEIFQKFGEYQFLGDDVDIVDMAPKIPPEALLSWLSVAANYLGSHAAPPSVRGMSEEGVRSGADRRLIIAQASTRYQYSNEAFKTGIAKVLSNCARIMKNVVPGSINVWARTPTDEFDIEIDKDKMKEPFTFYVEFAPISEEDEYRRHDDIERLLKSGIYTKKHAWKQMSNVDPEAMELQEEYELAKLDPAVQQVLSQWRAGKMLEALSKRTGAEALVNPPPDMGGEMPQGGMEPGRRLAPPIPQTAIPGSAQDLQNKLAGQRSQTSMTQQGMGGGRRGVPFRR